MLILCISFSDEESMEDNTSVRILDTAKESLLQGLTEENQGLQSVLTDRHYLTITLIWKCIGLIKKKSHVNYKNRSLN